MVKTRTYQQSTVMLIPGVQCNRLKLHLFCVDM